MAHPVPLAALAALAALPALPVEVARAPACPDAGQVRAAIALRAPPGPPPPAGAAPLRLDVTDSGGTVRVELRDAAGAVVLARELPAAGSPCAARADAVALVVERYLLALPAPPCAPPGAPVPRGAQITAPAGPPAEQAIAAHRSDAFALVEPWAGVALEQDVAGGTPGPALALGVAARPARALAAGLDLVLRSEQTAGAGSGRIAVTRHGAALSAALLWPRAGWRLEAGGAAGLDLVSARGRGLTAEGTATRANPVAAARFGSVFRLPAGLLGRVTLGAALALRAQSFVVQGASGAAHTPRAALALTLAVGPGLAAGHGPAAVPGLAVGSGLAAGPGSWRR